MERLASGQKGVEIDLPRGPVHGVWRLEQVCVEEADVRGTGQCGDEHDRPYWMLAGGA